MSLFDLSEILDGWDPGNQVEVGKGDPVLKVMNEMNKKFKEDVIQIGTGRIYVEKIPFTTPRANYCTYGGIPIGKATEFLGPEGGGKTTSAIQIVAEAQKKAKKDWQRKLKEVWAELKPLQEKNNKSDQDKIKKLNAALQELIDKGARKVIYIDAENTLDEDWAFSMGVDLDSLVLMRPTEQTAEQVLQEIINLVSAGNVELLVLDSVPMLVSQKLFDKTLEDKAYAGIADALTEFSRKISSPLSKNHTALLFINQIREDMDNPYNLYHTPGGRALRHLYALRIYFRKGKFINEKNEELTNSGATEPAGNLVDMRIIKTKVCKPNRLVGQYTIKYDIGADVMTDTIDMAVRYGFIKQSGAWFYIMQEPDTGEVMKDAQDNDMKFQGRPNLIEYFREDPDLFEEIREAVNMKLSEEE